MKKLLVSVLFACVSLIASDQVQYSEIKLVSGEVLKNAVIVSQTPTHVTVRIDRTMRQIMKSALPPDLQKLYPVDEAAARARVEAQRAMEEKNALPKVEYLPEGGARLIGPNLPKPPGSVAAKADAHLSSNGLRVSFVSDAASAPTVTITNTKAIPVNMFFSNLVAKTNDGLGLPLRVAAAGRIEGGNVAILGTYWLEFAGNETKTFQAYFYVGPNIPKHAGISDIVWAR